MAHYESYGETDMTFLVDNKNIMCQHNKLHPLPARRGKWISETMHEDIEKSLIRIHKNKYLQRAETIYKIINGLIVRLNIISFVAQIVLNHCI